MCPGNSGDVCWCYGTSQSPPSDIMVDNYVQFLKSPVLHTAACTDTTERTDRTTNRAPYDTVRTPYGHRTDTVRAPYGHRTTPHDTVRHRTGLRTGRTDSGGDIFLVFVFKGGICAAGRGNSVGGLGNTPQWHPVGLPSSQGDRRRKYSDFRFAERR